MSTPVVASPEGFELPEGQRRVIRWMIYLAFFALSIGILNGLGQALNYARIDILQYFPRMRTYHQGLTVHGVVNAIVFTFAFSNGFLALTTARALARPLNGGLLWAAFGSMVMGFLLAAFAMATGRASVLYTFYPPLMAHWSYYLGLALLVVSTWIIAVALFVALAGWRGENPRQRIPLLAFISTATYAMWCLASIGIAVEVVALLLPWSLGLVENVDPLLSRTLFWYSGHPIVYFWLLPAYVSWYAMVPKHAGGELFSDSLTRVVFVLFLLLSIPTGFHHQYADPGIATGMKAVHATLTFGVFFSSLITAFSIMYALEIGARRRGEKGLVSWFLKLDWKNPALLAQILAMLTFTLGGITRLINASYNLNQVIHNTAWIPGHFHMTVGSAVTLSFMGIAYWLVPYLTRRELVGRGLARAQAWLYALGVLIMARGLISGGLNGMPRRTLIMEAPYDDATWRLAGMLTGLGGTLMFVGGMLFFFVLVGTALFGKKMMGTVDIPFTVTHEGPATTGWAVKLDRYRYWVLATIILILIAYGPFLVSYLPGNFTSPGYQLF
ncbi:MAG: cbb3-type cytochrome c oxidase subunit I [Gemmatimonadota bacterium]